MKDRYTREYILDLLEKAKKIDCNYQVFAANRHKYKLNPPTSIKKVRRFERKFNIKLPEDYVYFLTQIGNGGAGPYYGLYSLEELISRQYCSCQNDKLKPVISENCTVEIWNDLTQQMKKEGLFDELEERVSAGVLNIGTQGCTFASVLVCKGEKTGEIVNVRWDLLKDEEPIFSNMSFLEWYVKYFELIVEGKSTYAYGWT